MVRPSRPVILLHELGPVMRPVQSKVCFFSSSVQTHAHQLPNLTADGHLERPIDVILLHTNRSRLSAAPQSCSVYLRIVCDRLLVDFQTGSRTTPSCPPVTQLATTRPSTQQLSSLVPGTPQVPGILQLILSKLSYIQHWRPIDRNRAQTTMGVRGLFGRYLFMSSLQSRLPTNDDHLCTDL